MSLTPQDIERLRAEENPRPEPRDQSERLRPRQVSAMLAAKARRDSGKVEAAVVPPNS